MEDERDVVFARMKAIHPPAADFFWVLWHTGMRFNELFSLPITGLFKATEIPNKSLHDELTKSNISYVGYIYLESQAANDDRKRDGILLVRKPLKSAKEIGGKNTRIIPIRTKEVWNMLAVRYKAGLEEFAKKTYGPDKSNYVLFEDLEWNKAVGTLRKAYADLKIPVKQYHCCRHTFTTLLVGETRSFFLTRAITGHKKDKSFERYLHIFERIAVEASVEEQEIDVI